MTEQELNKKLAEWAGFKYDDWLGWIYPDGENFDELPDFPNDLNACFKWLVPNIKDDITRMEVLISWAYEIYTLENPPALALCLAIEKLIDGGK